MNRIVNALRANFGGKASAAHYGDLPSQLADIVDSNHKVGEGHTLQWFFGEALVLKVSALPGILFASLPEDGAEVLTIQWPDEMSTRDAVEAYVLEADMRASLAAREHRRAELMAAEEWFAARGKHNE